jgi:YVTN family beta-propeller protein
MRLSANLAVLLVMILLVSVAAASARPAGAGTAPVSATGSGEATPVTGATALATISLKNITVGKGPDSEVYDPATQDVYVGNLLAGTVSAVNSTTYKVTTIPVGKYPTEMIYSASSKDVYVLNDESDNISVISTANKVVHTVKLPGLAAVTQIYDPANGNVYVVQVTSTGSELTAINHASFGLTNRVLPAGADYAAYDNASTSIVVSSCDLNEVTAASDTNNLTVVKLPTGICPVFEVYNPNNKDLYISDIGEGVHGFTKTGNLSVLSSANKIIKTFVVGSVPALATYDPSNHDVYLVNDGDQNATVHSASTVWVISSGNSVAKVISVGKDADIASYDPSNSEMYVSAAASNKTYAIDGSTNAIVATLTTTQYPEGAFYDPALGDMLVPGETVFENSSSTAKTVVTVIPSTNTGTSTLVLGTGPVGGGVYDPVDRGVWASNHGTTTVTIIL